MNNKPFPISKQAVLNAYKEVKANKGAPGYDQIDFEKFEKHLEPNLYKIWNRMSSGSYFPSPVLAVEIPKKNGKTRTLGIPTLEDRIAQTVVKNHIEPAVEPIFVEDSYGYRPGKSPIDAIGTARKRCWQYPYVIELDIKGLFDNIDHELLMKAVKRHVEDKWALLYIERWLKAPFIDRDGNITPREAGTPQGGVISPILANIFMHYAFDKWIEFYHPEAPFERYADDALIHCRTREEAEKLKAELAERFAQVKLEMNTEKTRIAYCRSMTNTNDEPITSFDFLGYNFTDQYQKCRDGKFRVTFIARVSKDAMKRLKVRIRALKIHLKSGSSLEGLAKLLNPIVRGWINYYGKYCPSAMRAALRYIDERLVKWAKRKYKSLKGKTVQTWQWLREMKKQQPDLFIHWCYL